MTSMSNQASQALRAYQKVEVETGIEQASPHQLVLMLFAAAIKAGNQALLHMQAGEIAAKGQAISRTIRMIEEGLKGSLDLEAGGEIAQQLSRLYDYMLHQLLQANLRNDVAPLKEVIRLLSDLRDTWASIETKAVETAAL